MIKAENIYKNYNDIEVLKGVNLEVKKGEIISIVGSSGAGKTTLLQILGTLTPPTQIKLCKLEINNTKVIGLNENQIAKFRNENIGFIFQFHQLLPEFSSIENVCIPAFIKGVSKEEAENKAKELLNFLGLSKRLNHKPSELSGGEQQRVAVARALINNPSLILADEPSGNLDSNAAEKLHELFFKLRDSFGYTFLIVTHNKDFAEMADRKISIVDGQISI